MFIQTQGIGGNVPPTAIPPHIEQVNFHSPNYIGNQSPQEERFQDHEFDYRRGGNEYRHNEMMEERDNRYRGGFRDNRERFDEDRRMGGRREYFDRNDDNFPRNRDNRNNRRYRENNGQMNEVNMKFKILTDKTRPLLTKTPEFVKFDLSFQLRNKINVLSEKSSHLKFRALP